MALHEYCSYEFRIPIEGKEPESTLNKYGLNGWEAYAATLEVGSFKDGVHAVRVYHFRRRVG